MRIGSELGGSITIEYETFRLREGEAFLVFIDNYEVLKVEPDSEVDSAGFSVQKKDSKVLQLQKGDHVI